MAVHTVCFRPIYNTPGRGDVTGAFAPEMERFGATRPRTEGHQIDNHSSAASMREAVLNVLGRDEEVDAVAFFCHGWTGGLQLGFRMQHIDALARAIAGCAGGLAITRARPEVAPVVPLYCCSTGGDPRTRASSPGTGDGAFADGLRDALCKLGREDVRVMAHSTVAHATKNPNVRFFDGMGSNVGGAGGYAPVGLRSPLWPAWKAALRAPKNTLRYRMPFLTVAEIHAELA